MTGWNVNLDDDVTGSAEPDNARIEATRGMLATQSAAASTVTALRIAEPQAIVAQAFT